MVSKYDYGVKVGDTIRIDYMNDDLSGELYKGRVGVVTALDTDPSEPRLDGTWGSLAVYPEQGDKYTVIKRA